MLLFLFLLFPVLFFALPWVLPPRWLPACGVTVVYGAICIAIDENRAQCATCGSFGSSLAWAFLMLTGSGFFIGFVARLVSVNSSEEGKTTAGPSAFSSGATIALAAVGFACSAVWLVVVTTKIWFDDGLWTHGVVVVLIFGWVALGRINLEKRERQAMRIFSGVGAVTTLCALAWSVQVSPQVIAAAEQAATDEPYCLLTSGRMGLRQVRSRFDLSGFVMQSGPISQRHATLAVGENRAPHWHYWSYRKEAFQPEFLGGVLTCDLQRNAAKDLGWFQARTESDGQQFWLAGGRWHIPAQYRGGAGDRPPVVRFYANGLDFGPLPVSARKLNINSEINAQVSVTLCELDKLHVWQAKTDINYTVEPAGMEADLEKQSVQSRGSSRKEFQYVGRNETGRISTWLLCQEGSDMCRHAFRREGVVVEFQHPRDQFVNWKDTQNAVWKRFKSFAVVWPDTGPQRCQS